jgi:hypothetical protein
MFVQDVQAVAAANSLGLSSDVGSRGWFGTIQVGRLPDWRFLPGLFWKNGNRFADYEIRERSGTIVQRSNGVSFNQHNVSRPSAASSSGGSTSAAT